MSQITVPLDTMVPISKFSRGGASAEFAKVADGVPVTVLKNSGRRTSSSASTTTVSFARRRGAWRISRRAMRRSME